MPSTRIALVAPMFPLPDLPQVHALDHPRHDKAEGHGAQQVGREDGEGGREHGGGASGAGYAGRAMLFPLAPSARTLASRSHGRAPPRTPPADRSAPGHPRRSVDTGGTFTDLVLAVPGGARCASPRSPSTPEDPGVRPSCEGLAAAGRPRTPQGATVVHGTTVALNALLTGRTGDAALVTNEGFEDLVEIDRQARPDLYAMEPQRPAALIPRQPTVRAPPAELALARARRGAVEQAVCPTAQELTDLCDRVVASGVQQRRRLPAPQLRRPRARASAIALRPHGIVGSSAPRPRGSSRSTARPSASRPPPATPRSSPWSAPTSSGSTGRCPDARLEVLQSSGGGLSAVPRGQRARSRPPLRARRAGVVGCGPRRRRRRPRTPSPPSTWAAPAPTSPSTPPGAALVRPRGGGPGRRPLHRRPHPRHAHGRLRRREPRAGRRRRRPARGPRERGGPPLAPPPSVERRHPAHRDRRPRGPGPHRPHGRGRGWLPRGIPRPRRRRRHGAPTTASGPPSGWTASAPPRPSSTRPTPPCAAPSA